MHYGETTHKGHYITTLYRDGQWIDCNDEIVGVTNDVPKMGYLFFYDRVSEASNFFQGFSMNSIEDQNIPTTSQGQSSGKKGNDYDESQNEPTKSKNKKRKKSEMLGTRASLLLGNSNH